MQLWITILEQTNIVRWEIISIINGQSTQGIIIVGYILLLAILLYIHSIFLKKQKKIREKLTETYDTMRYNLAQAQYKNTNIQDNKGIKITREWDKKNYFENEKEIKEELLSIEQQWEQQIISQIQRDSIKKQTHKKNILTIFVQTIGRIITIITIGIYKVFW